MLANKTLKLRKETLTELNYATEFLFIGYSKVMFTYPNDNFSN